MRVLIIEDERKLAEGLARGLGIKGVTAEWFPESVDAHDELVRTKGRYDAVLLDLMMPGMDGASILRSIRGADMDVPVIVLTARAEKEYRETLTALGASAYMVKPFSFDELLAKIRELVGAASGNKETSSAARLASA